MGSRAAKKVLPIKAIEIGITVLLQRILFVLFRRYDWQSVAHNQSWTTYNAFEVITFHWSAGQRYARKCEPM